MLNQSSGSFGDVWNITADTGLATITRRVETKGLILNADGTMDGVTREGVAFTGLPLVKVYNPIRIKSFSNLLGATAL